MAEPQLAAPEPGPWASDDHIILCVDDPRRYLAGVTLVNEVGIPADATGFDFDPSMGQWILVLPRPPVHRMEYLLRLHHADGSTETTTDPANPSRAPGAFGDKSVLEMPGYQRPAWLSGPQPWPTNLELAVPTDVGPVEVTVLSPAEPTRRLLLAHDGPEYARLASLPVLAATIVGQGRVPPFHLALVAPGHRDDWYSANPAYGKALSTTVLPELHAALGTTGPGVLMGASLGGLAALHAQRRYPDAIGGLFLQSGSFFVPEYDECESHFPYYSRIVRYVHAVLHGRSRSHPVPTVLTCGTVEENLRNNRLMASGLRRQGYPAVLHEVPDAHNYVGWRDAFDPYLTDLLRRVWADA